MNERYDIVIVGARGPRAHQNGIQREAAGAYRQHRERQPNHPPENPARRRPSTTYGHLRINRQMSPER